MRKRVASHPEGMLLHFPHQASLDKLLRTMEANALLADEAREILDRFSEMDSLNG